MSTIHRRRIGAFVLTGAALVGLAFAGPTAANAETANTNQYAVFYVSPTHNEGWIAIKGTFMNTAWLGTKNVTVAATCGTNVYTAAMTNTVPFGGPDRYAVWMPASEAGNRCYVWAWSTNPAETVVFDQVRTAKDYVIADATLVIRSSTGGL